MWEVFIMLSDWCVNILEIFMMVNVGLIGCVLQMRFNRSFCAKLHENITDKNLLVESTKFDVQVTNPLGQNVIVNLICHKFLL
ncbi:hypothetical protein EPI10_005872 [Gossypium australe]|uniref:Uncharacterized protein n=1 Tax=Gossypium australe TaxID=47621 RepID=A0A5B6WR79_9ROSI|nr:hypothetical protein EPI10_005872 [Gossypium australe]